MNVLAAATFDPGADAGALLSYLAWAATTAGVAGLIIVGLQMAIQFRRGDPGEGGQHFRNFYFVLSASIIASSAGPIVSLFEPFTI